MLTELDPDLPGTFRRAPYLMLGNLDPKIQRKVLDQMTEPALVCMDTMNFWMDSAMDTLRDKNVLEEMWEKGDAPWKVWDRPPTEAARAAFR